MVQLRGHIFNIHIKDVFGSVNDFFLKIKLSKRYGIHEASETLAASTSISVIIVIPLLTIGNHFGRIGHN